MPLVVPGSRFAERLRTAVRDDVDRLITKLIGLRQSDDEDAVNFEAALEFVYSNFDFHRFLDTDEDVVTRQLVALAEKFQVHSRQRDAQALQFLARNYLSLSPQARHTAASPHHYNCLRFVVLMAQRPTAAKYTFPGLEILQPAAWEDSVDWRQVLGPRSDPYQCDFNQDSDGWSQLSREDANANNDDDDVPAYFPLDPVVTSPPDSEARIEPDRAELGHAHFQQSDLDASSEASLVLRLATVSNVFAWAALDTCNVSR
jgi:hypothetical protein